MKLNMLIISDNSKRRTTAMKAIVRGCDQARLNLEVINFSKSSGAIEKVENDDPNIVLCDTAVSNWKDIRKKFFTKEVSRRRKKIFLLFYESNEKDCLNITQTDRDDIDGMFCTKSISQKTEEVCTIIARKLSISG